MFLVWSLHERPNAHLSNESRSFHVELFHIYRLQITQCHTARDPPRVARRFESEALEFRERLRRKFKLLLGGSYYE